MESGTRSEEMASIVLLGLTGAGKSTTFSTTFGTQVEAVANFTSATSTILENSVEVPSPDGGTKELIVVDTPGFGDTRQRACERDAQLLATLEEFLKRHQHLKSCYPSVVMLVMKFNDDRIKYETSHFIQMLKAIENFVSKGILIDKSKSSNLVVVLTHIMSEENEDLRIDPTPKIKIIEGLFKEFTSIAPPYFVVMAENKAEAYGLRSVSNYWELPNGDFYPYNLFRMIERVTLAAKDTVANNIFREAFKNPTVLKKSLKKQVPLMSVESMMVNKYFNLLKNSKFKIENTEISQKIQSIWASLPSHYTDNSGSTLQHVQKQFHEHGILVITDLPKKYSQVVKLISSLPLTQGVVQVLKELEIRAPEYPKGEGTVGNFYNIEKDEFTSSTPFVFSENILSHVGFMVQGGIKIDDLRSDENLIFELFQTNEEYIEYRLKQLKLHKQVPIDLVKSKPKPGVNLLDDLYETGIAVGIKEFRKYKISMSRPNFSVEYLTFLQGLPKFKPKSKTKLPQWKEYIKRGTHVLASAYAGGYVAVKATRNVTVDLTTSPQRIKFIVENMLDRLGELSSDNSFKEIKDFEFSIDFVGGDKDLAPVAISRMFSTEGVECFKQWEDSLFFQPVLLVSEMTVENIAECLPTGLSHVEPNIRLCLESLLSITESKTGKKGVPVEREKIKAKKEKDCVIM